MPPASQVIFRGLSAGPLTASRDSLEVTTGKDGAVAPPDERCSRSGRSFRSVGPRLNMFAVQILRARYTVSNMSTEQKDDADGAAPWPQQLLDSEWLLALAAILFFTLSYIVLGLIDLLVVGSG